MGEKLSLEEIQDVEFNMLVDVFDYCKSRGITFFLDSGTLLGAVRSQDFIPWDDDADIIMPRNDYEKFRRSFDRDSRYQVADKDYPSTYLKIFDPETKLVETELRNGYPIGVFIDVFPLDNLPNNKAVKWKYFISTRFLTYLTSYAASTYITSRRGIKGKIRIFASFIGGIVNRFLSATYIATCADRAAKHYQKIDTPLFTKVLGSSKFNVQYKKSWFANTKLIKFRDRELPIPEHADEYLEELFGLDYMTPPPLDQRGDHGHIFEVTWKKDANDSGREK
jgi:lipopolysaccharide cholinephosphotransferase